LHGDNFGDVLWSRHVPSIPTTRGAQDMKRLPILARLTLWSVLALVLAISLFLGGAMAYGAFRNERLLAIESQNGIDESMYVSIGGVEQWIQIRGQDRNNPVLLWLHGGPGFSTIPATAAYIPWEKDFTLVMWDQRGDGKSFQKTGPSVAGTMTMERMAQDGIEVVEFLRAHLRKERIILLGHSWGSMLGLRMIAQRPDLFLAYVGTGQNVNVERGQEEIGYPQILAKARTLGNRRAVSALERVGPPPYRILSQYYVPIGWENRLDARRPPFSIAGFGNFMSDVLLRPYLRNGAEFSQALMLPAMLNEDAFAIATHFDVPVIFIQGRIQWISATPSNLSG
jgi:pimeloyl-ACP methyl ester carboxylesterase